MFRVIAPVLCEAGKVVQSRGFREINPLGNLDLVIESLKEIEPDEISILSIDGKIGNVNFQTNAFQNLNLPLTIGGGVTEAVLCEIPAERFLLNSVFFGNDISPIKKIINSSGAQSLIAYLPFKIKNDEVFVWNSTTANIHLFDSILFDKVQKYSAECVLLDMDAQGYYNGFDFKIFDLLPYLDKNKSLICGGINQKSLDQAKKLQLGGALIDNQALYYNQSVHKR